jgi:hypothetical protein
MAVAEDGLENATLVAIEAFRAELETLHDVRTRWNVRLRELRRYADAVGNTLDDATAWQSRLASSLLTGEIWAACMRHVRRREGRVRELMAATGVQDLYNAQERVLNASLRVTASAAERQTVTDWFGEIASYAWWPGDDLPAEGGGGDDARARLKRPRAGLRVRGGPDHDDGGEDGGHDRGDAALHRARG